MLLRSIAVGIVLALAGAAQAATLRVTALPPLSAERLGDALRSYVEGAEVTVVPVEAGSELEGGPRPEPGAIGVALRGNPAAGEDVEVVVVDGEETILARLPGALRTADLYRTAALKVQSLLERRATAAVPGRPAASDSAAVAAAALPSPPRDRLWVDAGLAILVPTTGPLREGLRLGVGARPAARLRLGLGAYLEPSQATTTTAGIDVTAWELPFFATLGVVWHQGLWQGWVDATGQAVVRRVKVAAVDIGASADTGLAVRAGGVLGIGVPLGPALRAELRASLLASLVDARYRVDGQVVWPAAPALFLVELGLAYGVR